MVAHPDQRSSQPDKVIGPGTRLGETAHGIDASQLRHRRAGTQAQDDVMRRELLREGRKHGETPSSASELPTLPKPLKRYNIVGYLGQRAMSTVWKAKDINFSLTDVEIFHLPAVQDAFRTIAREANFPLPFIVTRIWPLLLKEENRRHIPELVKSLPPEQQALLAKAARDIMNPDHFVAIKVLKNGQEQNVDLRHEAQTLAKAEHPNVVRVYNVQQDPETQQIYMVMQLVDSPLLSEHIKVNTIPLDTALDIAEQMASAVDYMAGQGIIHRDLKPSNIFFEDPSAEKPTGKVLISDFGLASGVVINEANQILGTPLYQSPESLEATGINLQSEVYTQAVIVYELLVGEQLMKPNNNLGASHQ